MNCMAMIVAHERLHNALNKDNHPLIVGDVYGGTVPKFWVETPIRETIADDQEEYIKEQTIGVHGCFNCPNAREAIGWKP